MKPPEVVVLVPWRGGDRWRDENYQIALPYIKELGYPVVEGDRPGPWSRSAAVNAAAAAAGAWDVAVIIDADTVPEPESITRAIRWVMRSRGGVRPHDRLWRLTRQGTRVFAARGPGAIVRQHHTGTFLGGGVSVVHRQGWDRVGGFDEAYVEWGFEDSAFNTMLLVKANWDQLEGEGWHLWHPRAPMAHPRTQENRRRYKEFESQHWRAIARAARHKGWDPNRKYL